MMINPKTLVATLPAAKKTLSAVRRYCLRLGKFSRNSVPSVGMLPPTPVPRQKSRKQRAGKEVAKADSQPKMAVTSRVPLNASLRPYESESEQGRGHDQRSIPPGRALFDDSQEPHAIAPTIMPANIDEDKAPIQLSLTAN